MIAMAGMDPMQWIDERDDLLRSTMQKIAQRRVEIAAEERQDLAERIVGTLGKHIK